MIRLLIITIFFCGFTACNNQDAPACLKSSGNMVETTIDLPDFNGLEVNQEFKVYIEKATIQEITITAGENLLSSIDFKVIDNQLIISNNNSCDWVRTYDFPVVHIKHPNLSVIRQNGGGSIESISTLDYPEITLYSEASTGDFDLQIDCNQLTIVNNDLSNYSLSGNVDQLTVGFFSGDSRFEGANLIAEKASVFHRGTNDVVVNVKDLLTGRILSTGDLIYVGNTPNTIDVSLENRGNLINKTN